MAPESHFPSEELKVVPASNDPASGDQPDGHEEQLCVCSNGYNCRDGLDLDRENRLLLTSSFAAGISMITGSIFLLQSSWFVAFRWIAWGMLILGIIIFILSVLTMERPGRMSWTGLIIRSAEKLGLSAWQPISLFLAMFLSLIASLAAGTDAMMLEPVLAVFSWICAIGTVILGGWRFGKTRLGISRRTFYLLVALFIVSFLIRGYGTQHIPIVLSGDEASSGLNALQFLEGATNNIFRAGWFSFPAFFFFVQSIPIALLGNTIPALRLLSALVGAATVAAVFVLARSMFGAWAAFFSAVFLAAFHFHHHFSRIGLNNIWDGLWFVLVLGLLWAGWEREERRFYLGAGLALGLSQYFYITSRVMFAIILVWLLLAWAFHRAKLKQVWPDLVLMGYVCLVVVLPLAVFYLRYPQEYFAPLRRVSIFGAWMQNEIAGTGFPPWIIMLRQIGRSYMGFAFTPIRTWYAPGTPLLRPFSAILFFLGAALLVLRPRNAGVQLLGIWIISFGIIGGFSESTPAAQRYVAAAPAVALVVGFGLDKVTAHLSRLWPALERYIYIIAVMLLFTIAVDELRFYFLDYTPHGRFGGMNNLVAQRLADHLKDKDPSWKVHFFGYPRMGYYSFSTLPYLAPHIEGFDMPYAWNSPDNPEVNGDHLIFVFLPEHASDLNNALEDFPQGKLVQELDDEQVLYWLYEISLEQ